MSLNIHTCYLARCVDKWIWVVFPCNSTAAQGSDMGRNNPFLMYLCYYLSPNTADIPVFSLS